MFLAKDENIEPECIFLVVTLSGYQAGRSGSQEEVHAETNGCRITGWFDRPAGDGTNPGAAFDKPLAGGDGFARD